MLEYQRKICTNVLEWLVAVVNLRGILTANLQETVVVGNSAINLLDFRCSQPCPSSCNQRTRRMRHQSENWLHPRTA